MCDSEGDFMAPEGGKKITKLQNADVALQFHKSSQ